MLHPIDVADDLMTEVKHSYAAANIDTLPITMERGNGAYVYDSEGKSYIDMLTGIAVLNFGHGHPRLVQALKQQADTLAVMPRIFENKPLNALLKKACTLCHMDQGLPINGGVEAVETAIKLIRKWAYTVKNIAEDQAEIITCDDSFHGRTVTAISMSTVAKYKAHFGPLTPGMTSIPFNDIEAFKRSINKNTAAFLVEPIQGEAGVIIPDAGYLKQCEKLCKENNVLFILDEIQTGLGRTGKNFAMEHENLNPDGILLGKALGGGLLPISLFLGKSHLMGVIQPGEHGSTLGGNPLASAVAHEALNLLIEENLAEHAANLGDYFLAQLKTIKSNAILAVRGKGLFIALDINTAIISSNEVVKRLVAAGLLSLNTRNKSIRLLPPLNITKDEIDQAFMIIKKVFAEW